MCRLAPAGRATPSKPVKHRSPALPSVKETKSDVLQTLVKTLQTMAEDIVSKSEVAGGELKELTETEDSSKVLVSVPDEDVDSTPIDSNQPIGESATDSSKPTGDIALDPSTADTATKDLSDQSQGETTPSEEMDIFPVPLLPPKPKLSSLLSFPPSPFKSSTADSSPPPIPPHAPRSTTHSKPTRKKEGDDWELAVLVDKILSTSDVIAEVVTVIRLERGGQESSPGADKIEKAGDSFDTYSKELGPLQFGK